MLLVAIFFVYIQLQFFFFLSLVSTVGRSRLIYPRHVLSGHIQTGNTPDLALITSD